MYSVVENGGSVQIVLVLSNPSSTEVTVQALNRDGSANSKNKILKDIIVIM